MKPWVLLASLVLAAGGAMTMNVRSRVELYKGSGEWREVRLDEPFEPGKTALVLCDVWDRHWCSGATERVAELAPKIDRLVRAARAKGVLIIHAPSDTMEFYKDAPQRRAMLQIAPAQPPEPLQIDSPPLPIDDSDGGCDTPDDKTHKAWTRQHAAIGVEPQDLISDNGQEVYNALRARGITRLLVAGVHTNMCILNRGFAIKQMTRWGVRCTLVRDLTDSMYNPARAPHVSHAEGTELVIRHIEQYWCPTVLSSELMRVLAGK